MEKESIINLVEEKSVFERAIIEAFKQKSFKAIYEKLNIALDEIKYIVADIKKNNQFLPGQFNQNSTCNLITIHLLLYCKRIIQQSPKNFLFFVLIPKIF